MCGGGRALLAFGLCHRARLENENGNILRQGGSTRSAHLGVVVVGEVGVLVENSMATGLDRLSVLKVMPPSALEGVVGVGCS
jgi:hypothetical protein